MTLITVGKIWSLQHLTTEFFCVCVCPAVQNVGVLRTIRQIPSLGLFSMIGRKTATLLGTMVNVSEDRFLGGTSATEMNHKPMGTWTLKGHFGCPVKVPREISSEGWGFFGWWDDNRKEGKEHSRKKEARRGWSKVFLEQRRKSCWPAPESYCSKGQVRNHQRAVSSLLSLFLHPLIKESTSELQLKKN